MLRQLAILEVKKNSNIYQMQLPPEAPLGEFLDVLFEMRGFGIERIQEAHKADRPKDPVDPKVEVIDGQ